MAIEISPSNPIKRGMTFIENKKRRIGDGPGLIDSNNNNNTELDLGLEEEEVMRMDQDVQHNLTRTMIQKTYKRRTLQ